MAYYHSQKNLCATDSQNESGDTKMVVRVSVESVMLLYPPYRVFLQQEYKWKSSYYLKYFITISESLFGKSFMSWNYLFGDIFFYHFYLEKLSF